MTGTSRRSFLAAMLTALPAVALAPDDPNCGSLNSTSPFEIGGFTLLRNEWQKKVRTVYRRGSGPAVLLLHELPGLYRGDINLACRIAQRGFTVFMPLLFGKPGDYRAVWNLIAQCLGPSEITCWRSHTGAAVNWLSDFLQAGNLTGDNGQPCGGKGVGVVGMCMTGGFPLSLAAIDKVQAAVMCQPTFPLWPRNGSLDLSPKDLKAAVGALERKQMQVLGLKFACDPKSPDKRWDTMHRELQGHFTEIILDCAGHSHSPHSTLAAEYSPTPGTPTHEAFERVIRYLDHRLSTTPQGADYPPADPAADCVTGMHCRSY